MPRLTIRARSCAAIASLPCSVVVPAYDLCSASLPPTSTMLALPGLFGGWKLTSSPFALGSSVWMRAIGVCNLSAGSMASWARWPSFLGSATRRQNRSCLPPTWTAQDLGKCTAIERFFGRVFLFFHLQRPPLCGWSAIATRVALTYTAFIVIGLAAPQAGRPDLIRSRHSRARAYVGGRLNDEMLSRNLSARQYFFQPILQTPSQVTPGFRPRAANAARQKITPPL